LYGFGPFVTVCNIRDGIQRRIVGLFLPCHGGVLDHYVNLVHTPTWRSEQGVRGIISVGLPLLKYMHVSKYARISMLQIEKKEKECGFVLYLSMRLVHQ